MLNTELYESLFPNTPIQISMDVGVGNRPEIHLFAEGVWDSKVSLETISPITIKMYNRRPLPKQMKELRDAPQWAKKVLENWETHEEKYMVWRELNRAIVQLAKTNKESWNSAALRINPKWSGWSVIDG